MAAEQEITISYASLTAEGGGAVPASARQEYLRDTFAFECACAACVAGDALPRVGQPPQLDGFSQPPAPSQKHRTLMLASVGVKDKYVFILHVHPRDASARVDAYCVNFGCERVHLSDDQMRAARDALTAGGGEAGQERPTRPPAELPRLWRGASGGGAVAGLRPLVPRQVLQHGVSKARLASAQRFFFEVRPAPKFGKKCYDLLRG